CIFLDSSLLSPKNYLRCLHKCYLSYKGCRVHVHNVQVCYICILVPCCCAAPINSSFTVHTSYRSV
uniref:Uncharacterized protein n=1 Tax=Macaca fascicularis TaxID=9541 RepID=A0A7N9CPC3_MACFA